MSQTRSTSILQMRATPSVVINNSLRQIFAPATLAQSPIHRLAAVIVSVFFTFTSVIHNFVMNNVQQNQNESRILRLWSVSCIITGIQLSLTCWLLFTIAPGIQILCQLTAWMLSGVGYIFSFLIGTVICYVALLVILLVPFCQTVYVLMLNTSDDHNRVQLIKNWSYAGAISVAVFLCTVTGGMLVDRLTLIFYWFIVAAGVFLTFCLRLIVICLIVGVIILSGLSVLAVKQHSNTNRLDSNYGNPLRFDDHNETVIRRQISVCLTKYILHHCSANNRIICSIKITSVLLD